MTTLKFDMFFTKNKKAVWFRQAPIVDIDNNPVFDTLQNQ
jgi:hypothetical protein